VCNEHEKMLHMMESEVEAAIKGLKKGKEPGEDNIAAEMIQARGGCSLEMLHGLCNQIYNQKECPEDRDRVIIVPTDKKGDRVECGNY